MRDTDKKVETIPQPTGIRLTDIDFREITTNISQIRINEFSIILFYGIKVALCNAKTHKIIISEADKQNEKWGKTTDAKLKLVEGLSEAMGFEPAYLERSKFVDTIKNLVIR